MEAVRATPTMGGSSGRVQTRGCVVYPNPRRAGATSSRALQTVGVSIRWSAALKFSVRSGIDFSPSSSLFLGCNSVVRAS
jgi:hypothetical protein